MSVYWKMRILCGQIGVWRLVLVILFREVCLNKEGRTLEVRAKTMFIISTTGDLSHWLFGGFLCIWL